MSYQDHQKNYLSNILKDMYLDWVNNFLTVEKFAEYYTLSVKDALVVIERGRKLHEEEVS